MASNFVEKQAGKFAKIIDPKLPYIEIACLIIAIAAELTLESNPEVSRITILIVLSILSVLYYFNAFRIGEDIDNAFEKFYIKLFGFANAVSVLGILFFINNYAGASIMTNVGMLSLIIAVFLVFGLKYFQKINTVRRVDIIRAVVLLVLIGSFYISIKH
ncbi:MAG: hypothetical protein DRJ05_11180 [Bacteroidetes bacterium]|nr:MAG: hypothetical protein DRJ05_11180 [Bacteroidota bacterium]